MSYLQLAESNPYERLAAAPINKDFYIFVPAGFMGAEQDMYIREDKLDSLPDNEYQILMAKLAPFQPAGLSGKHADKKAKKQAAKDARRKQRQDAKQKRVETRSSAIGSALGKAGDIVSGLIGGKSPVSVDASVGGTDISVDTSNESFWDKYKTPILIAGGLAAVGIIYTVTKGKGSKRK